MSTVKDGLFHRYQEHSWGSNGIALHPWFRPAYYANVDKSSLETELGRDIAATGCRAARIGFILSDFAGKMVSEYGLGNIVPVHRFNSVYGKTKFLASPLDTGFSTAAPSVTFILMQLAYAEGYNTLLMVGLDHTYGLKQPHFYDDKLTAPYHVKNDMENETWRTRCDFGFTLARKFLEERGGRIVNLTSAKTTTNVFERGKVEDWI